jgi:tetratricopeptide (TPR) repeat protein
VLEPAAVLRRSARRAIADDRLDEADGIVRRLKELEPMAVETRALELELLVRGGRHDDAENLAAQLVERFPDSPRVLYLAGRVAYLRKEYPSAERRLLESDRLDSHPWTRRLLGKTLTQMGRLDEAEAILLELAPAEPACLKDLAWLHERRGDPARAAERLEAYLATRPDDAAARAHLRRVRAASLDPGDMLREVEGMLELGETVPENLWPAYCEAALRLARRDPVAAVVRERLPALEIGVATGIAWVCYRMQAYDLAFEAFRTQFERGARDFKLLNAFEAAARRAGRLEKIAALYAEHAPAEPRLYGRIKRLEARR